MARLMINNTQKAFLEFIKAGLWEKEVQLSSYGHIDYSEVMRLAKEQSMLGLVAAGLEHVEDKQITKRKSSSICRSSYATRAKESINE